jgi:sulfatase-like protein
MKRRDFLKSTADLNLGVLKMPYNYWQRGLDSYTQVMQIVDAQIGRVLESLHSLPRDVVENTVVVFAADHGEYSGAHGFGQGKLGTVYAEAWHIPLIVVDPSHRFTGDIQEIRNGLASSVDLSTLLVSIGNKGSCNWMNRDLAQIYGDRHDMISMLKSAKAPGRPYVRYATDEVVPDYYNFNRAPTHVLGVRTEDTKLGTLRKMVPGHIENHFELGGIGILRLFYGARRTRIGEYSGGRFAGCRRLRSVDPSDHSTRTAGATAPRLARSAGSVQAGAPALSRTYRAQTIW